MGVGATHMQEDFRSNHQGHVQGFSGILEMQRHSHYNFWILSFFLKQLMQKMLVAEITFIMTDTQK